VRLFRIAREKYKQDLSGYGSALYGGRWNNKGTSALYTATHISLAVLEMVAQARRTYIAQEGAWLLELELAVASHLHSISHEALPADWRNPARIAATQAIGDQQFQAGNLGLIVPSAVLPRENNVVLNPRAVLYAQIKIVACEPLDVDDRLGLRAPSK